MCGIIGFWGKSTPENIELIENMLIQASYRGTHATGISWVGESGAIRTYKMKESAKKFVETGFIKNALSEVKYIRLIGHTRYITSGGEDQPISPNGGYSLALNGVISQDKPANWQKLVSSYNYTTGNDAEIFMHYSLNHSIDKLVPLGGSFATLELIESSSGAFMLRALRNGTRPLYKAHLPDGSYSWASTADMFKRVGVNNSYLLSPQTIECQLENNYEELKCRLD